MIANVDFTVKFWGVRGSLPVPGPHTVRFGGNTSCADSNRRASDYSDAGSDLPFGQELLQRGGCIRETFSSPIATGTIFRGFPFSIPDLKWVTTLRFTDPKEGLYPC